MTTKDTYNEIVEEVQSQAEFQSLEPENESYEKFMTNKTSNSSADTWRSIAWLVSTIQTAFRTEFNLFKAETKNTARSHRSGMPNWWLRILDEFQYGDSLVVIDGVPEFETIDEAKRIITNRSHEEVPGGNRLKAVKGVFPDFTPLSVPEYQAVFNYLKRKRPPGIDFILISEAAEEIKITGNVFYNSTQDLVAVKLEVEAAIDKYIKYLPIEGKVTEFNGTYVRNELIRTITALDSIVDFELIEVIINDVDRTDLRTYKPLSGWMRIKNDSPLNTTLQYSPSNV